MAVQVELANTRAPHDQHLHPWPLILKIRRQFMLELPGGIPVPARQIPASSRARMEELTRNAIDNGLGGSGVGSIVIDPTTPQTIYAAVGGVQNGVFKSTDGGNGWAKVTEGDEYASFLRNLSLAAANHLCLDIPIRLAEKHELGEVMDPD